MITSTTCLDTALELLIAHDLWPVAIYPPGVKLGDRMTKGKEPIGLKWGLAQWSERRIREAFRDYPTAGVGICLGPNRGPGGSWLIDIEGDGGLAETSCFRLMGGEVIATMSWSSVRGWHRVFRCDGERLLGSLARAGAQEGTGIKSGVWHLDILPDLEIRVGGYKDDGTVKQVQSVVPPTPGTDGTPRRWTHVRRLFA